MQNCFKILWKSIPLGQKTITAFAIIIILFGFTETTNMVTGNWYQQFLPSIGNRQITDITFIDSLTGYAVTNNLSPSDTGFILKTTNSGDSWNFNLVSNKDFFRIKFINNNTGYASGGSGGGTAYLYKTTNAGVNWSVIPTPGATAWRDMSVLNIDTIWLVDNDALVGGVFRTTNGGGSWTQQLALGNLNPTKIYMYNARIGYICRTNSYTRKTTDGGASWFVLVSNEAFTDMYFTDSLTGWRAYTTMKKTTDGGLNWISQVLPQGGMIINSQILKFSNVNTDTIWGVGARVQYPNTQSRGMLYRTTNGGDNWLFQIPDTTINIFQYLNIQFINKNIGWAYGGPRGIHTTNGGDTTFLVGVKQISSRVPKQFKLYQNYPNPFNPVTNIEYELKIRKFVKLKVFDITGKEVLTLVNQMQNAGTYRVDFSGNNYSSGVYFYSLIIDGNIIDTKKMILVK